MSRKARKLKHAGKLAQYDDCPPKGCQPYAGDAFRFVNNPVVAEDFETQADRFPNIRTYQCCAGHALSLFVSLESAKARFAELSKTSRNFVLRTGGYIALGELSGEHGIAGEVNESGHFELYEWEGVDLIDVFEIVGPADA